MQIFVVYSDATAQGEPDQYKARREALSQLWSLDQRPSGCGVCVAFEDVGSFDLTGWCDAIKGALKLDEDDIRTGVELALPGGRRVPMLEAESVLAPIVRPFIQKSR